MKLIKTLIILMSLALVFNSCGQKTKDSEEIAEDTNDKTFEDTDVKKDVTFAENAAEAGTLEVHLAQLALTKSASPEVKQFAQEMIDDHTRANEELKSLAAQKNIALPTTLTDDSQKKIDDLSSKDNGEDFDKAYCSTMVKAHKDNVDAFKKESEKGNDPDLKNWATEKLPVLEQHLAMAKTIEDNRK